MINDSLKIFLDTANIAEIKSALEYTNIDGITTNPSIAAKLIKNTNDKFAAYKDILAQITEIINGPISAEVIACDYENMMKEALEFSKIAKNIIIKLPMTINGLKACRELTSKHNLETNMTLCFSCAQATLCARNGATYISPFIGRIDDTEQDGTELIESIRTIYDNYQFETKILAASIRSINHVKNALEIGVDALTVPYAIFKKMHEHILTDQGILIFEKDWGYTMS